MFDAPFMKDFDLQLSKKISDKSKDGRKDQITFKKKEMMKEYIMQVAEQITKDSMMQKRKSYLKNFKRTMKAKQDYNGRNVYVEESVEKYYNALKFRSCF